MRHGSPAARSAGDTPAGTVILAVNSLDGGGAERIVLLLRRLWATAGTSRDPHLELLVSVRAGAYADEVGPGDVAHVLGRTGILRRAHFWWRLRRALRGRSQITILSNSTNLSRRLLVARRLGIIDAKIVVVEHNSLSERLRRRGRLRRRLEIALMRRDYSWADRVVGVSVGVSRDVESVLGLGVGSVVTIRNGVDRERVEAGVGGVPDPGPFAGVFGGLARPVVVSVGRLVEQKAQVDLVEAFARLPEGSGGSLVVLGEGPLRGVLEERVRELGLEGRVVLPGFVGNPWWFVARADLFVLSSRFEGFPLVLLEALVCGVRVVATDCPSGPREILEGVEGAWLVPVGDVGALSDAMGTALTAAADGTPLRNVDRVQSALSMTAQYVRLVDDIDPSAVGIRR